MYPDPSNCDTEVHYDLSECAQRKTYSSPPFSSPLLRLTDAIRSIRVGPGRPPKGRPLERGVPCPARPLPACDVCCLFFQLDMMVERKSAMSVFGSTVNGCYIELGLLSRPWIQHLIGDLDWGLLGCYVKKKQRLHS